MKYLVIATVITKYYVEAESTMEAEQMVLNGHPSVDEGNSEITYETEEIK